VVRRCPGSFAVLLLFSLVLAVVVTPGSASATTTSLPSLHTKTLVPTGAPAVSGPIGSPGGPYLFDRRGRVVFFHGVNAVYKHPPYELFPAPGKRWNFSAADASLMARLGFNVVRLGMTWKGLEPGTAPANDPAICTTGAPHDPGQFNRAILDRYLHRLKQTVDLLGRHHVYTLLDMHQDVYNELFDGEGAPNWAVCTDGLPNVDKPGRWSRNYATAAANAAYAHFWTNNVVGNLQGEFDRVWVAVARYFRGDPWVLGYDPFNEPFSVSLVTSGNEQFDGQLRCFYAGVAFANVHRGDAPVVTCPVHDPAAGVIPQIEEADPGRLIFEEPDIFGARGYPNQVGSINFPNIVFNVHTYCGSRSGTTGNPIDLARCAAQEERSLTTKMDDRLDLGTPSQPAGAGWFVSEFGATSSSALLTQLTNLADQFLVGWTYWSWKYYDDPTGSAAEALVTHRGKIKRTSRVLSRTYAEAVAGLPTSMSFDPVTGAFHLAFDPNQKITRPTVIFVPVAMHYRRGYCATVHGGRVTSTANATLLTVANARRSTQVVVSVSAGHC
jgi:endoglycosylceramidase